MDLKGTIWLFGDIVVKCELDPWTTLLGENNTLEMFHMFIFEEDESTLMGNGLPNVVRDSQMGLCAAVRMALDNGSIAFGQNLEINTDLLSMNQDITSIQPNKIWYREDSNPSTLAYRRCARSRSTRAGRVESARRSLPRVRRPGDVHRSADGRRHVEGAERAVPLGRRAPRLLKRRRGAAVQGRGAQLRRV
jgi:hypothetical protein